MGCTNERRKQRVSIKRLRFVFWMKLTTKEPRMDVAGQFDHFDKFAIGRDAAKNEAFSLEDLTKFRVEFVPMAVTLAKLVYTAVNFASERVGSQVAGPGTKSHSSSQFLDVHQIAQFEDDRIRCLQIKFRRISVLQPTNVSRILDTCGLH